MLADRMVVVTAGPGPVKAVNDFDLPRPRGAVQEMRFQPRFLELHRRIWDREEVERANPRTAQATNSGGDHSCAPVHAITKWTRGRHLGQDPPARTILPVHDHRDRACVPAVADARLTYPVWSCLS